jgi:uncharacterized Ntn-hydrolase superfamily protein
MSGKKPANAWHDVRGVTYEELRSAEEEVMKRYGDIIDEPRPRDKSRKRNSANRRAAQFLPFAALTGFDDEIAEEERLTDERIELSEEQKEQLDRTLQRAEAMISPEVTAVVFEEDTRKAGGAYVKKHGFLKNVDFVNGILQFTDRTKIPIHAVVNLYLHESAEETDE